MSTGEHKVSQGELHAYADQELSPERAAAVEDWLQHDADARALVRDVRHINESLRAMYGAVAEEPVPARLRDTAQRRNRRWRVLTQVAAALALLVAGAAAGWFARDFVAADEPVIRALATESFSAHKVFVVEVKHPVEVGASEEQHLVRWLTKRLGAPVKAPNLQGLGYQLVGGRLLSADEGPAAQFMYETENGQRITLYVRQNSSGRETAFRYQAAGNLSGFYWLEGPLAYAIVAEMPREKALELARVVYEQLGG